MAYFQDAVHIVPTIIHIAIVVIFFWDNLMEKQQNVVINVENVEGLYMADITTVWTVGISFLWWR